MAADKSFIISCVNDALKMEKSIYTLNEIAGECNARADSIMKNINQKKQAAEKLRNLAHGSIERCRTCIENTKKHPIEECYHKLGFLFFASVALYVFS